MSQKRLSIVAIMGQTKAGKDTAGQMLLEMSNGHGCSMQFARQLKNICAEMFGLNEHQLYDEAGKEEKIPALPCMMCPTCNDFDIEEIVNDGRPYAACKRCGAAGERKAFESFWTGRKIAQFIGTECFRRVFPRVWTNFLLKAADRQLADANTHVIFVTDCRFPNEATAVLEAGGEVWRLKRPATDSMAVSTGIKGHVSETAMADFPDSKCSAVIVNDGTLEDLCVKLQAQLTRFKARR